MDEEDGHGTGIGRQNRRNGARLVRLEEEADEKCEGVITPDNSLTGECRMHVFFQQVN